MVMFDEIDGLSCLMETLSIGDLNRKVIRISVAEIKDGGEGAIYIFLKNNKNL